MLNSLPQWCCGCLPMHCYTVCRMFFVFARGLWVAAFWLKSLKLHIHCYFTDLIALIVFVNEILKRVWSYREDGELEDGEIDDEGIGIEEVKDIKEESEEVEKEKEKGKDREKEDKSHRHSRKRHRKIKEKRRSKRRRRDRQKVRSIVVSCCASVTIFFTISLTFFAIQHHSPSSGSSSDSYDSEHERQDRPKSKKSKGTYRDHDGELAQVRSGSGTGFKISLLAAFI